MTITEIRTAEVWIGRTLSELELRKNYDVQVAAVRTTAADDWSLPNPDLALERGDIILAAGTNSALQHLLKETGN